MTEKQTETDFLMELFSKWTSHKLNYCVLRNYESLPHDTAGSDIDLFVVPDDCSRFMNILEELILKYGGRIICRYHVGSFICACCCGNVKGQWWGVQFDIHLDETYKGIPFFDKGWLIQNKKKHNGIFVADKNDASVLSLLKEGLSNGKTRKSYEIKAISAYQENDIHYLEMFKKYFGSRTAYRWGKYFEDGHSEEVFKTLSAFSRWNLLLNGLRQHPISTIKRVLKYQTLRFRRIINPIGFSVAVLGTDGSGKTTVIEGIKTPLESGLHTQLSYEHLRPNLLPSIARLFGRCVKKGPVTNPHASNPSGFLGSFLRLTYYSLDYILGYWLKIYPAMVKKPCFYVFDRYFYDFFVDPIRSRIYLPKSLIKFVSLIIPKPDLILCLGTEPEIIHARKTELPLAEVERQVRALKLLCHGLRRAVWIDTGQSIDDSVDQALCEIVKHMSERYDR